MTNKTLRAGDMSHAVLSATHTDTDPDTLVRGDLLVASGATPLLTRYALSVPAANLMNVLGVVNGETEPTWKALLDATNPATLTVASAAAPGTATIAAHRDHVHAITSSSNPGAAAAILASAPTTGLLTLTQLATTVNLQTLNAELTVANKNKYLPYLQDAEGVYLRKQTYYWNGSSYVATHGYGFGYYTLLSNTGARSNGFGHAALQNNTGAYSNGFGYTALQNNVGAQSNGFGYAALLSNTGANSNGFGYAALQNNTGANSNGFGYLALQNNTGANSNGFGHAALRYNNWPNVSALGYQSSPYFLDDPATSKAFTDAEITADTITFPSAHGFGATDAKVNLRFSTVAGTPPTGLVHNTVYQFTITSPTVMTLAGIGTNASADFEGKLTNSVDITGSIAIGYDANASKAHQVMLGGTDIVETLLRGKTLVNTTTVGAQLAVDQSSAVGALPVLLLDQGDDDEPMIEFTGTVGVGNVIEAVGAKTLTATHFLKVEITGVGIRYIPLGTIA